MRQEEVGSFEEIVARAAEVLREAGAAEVFLFGSHARGTARRGSDLDLAVTGLPPQAFFSTLARLGDAIGRPIDLVDLDEVNPFTTYLKQRGRLRRVA